MTSLQTLQSYKERMVEYLKLKVMQEDWHGVADAAMDIREIEAKMSVLKKLIDTEEQRGQTSIRRCESDCCKR